MDFGKLAQVDHVDFRLPQDLDINKSLVINSLRSKNADVYIGSTGYATKELVGSWYKTGSKPNQFLEQYAQVFDTIELNATYYRSPDTATIERWVHETPQTFRFCPKIPKNLSHSTKFGENSPEIAQFCAEIVRLQQKLGCCFLQLPPHFGLADINHLESFLSFWPCKEVPIAVEVRHQSYFHPDAIHQLLALLHKYGAYTVITDVAGRRDVCHSGLSGSKVMIRLVGNSMHITDKIRADLWTQKLQDWINIGVHEIYLCCHQPDPILAAEYCAIVATAAQKLTSVNPIKIPKPQPLQNGQLSLFSDF
jgi:uncharacterized protein YecE (DUF72 family)